MDSSKTSGKRNRRANILVMSIFLAVFLLGPAALCIWHVVWSMHQQQRVQSAVDAAALQAANEISRVTINDSAFGFIALANAPPIGLGTLALSGKPLPVESFNTLVGTVRLDKLIARQLNSDQFSQLAQNDVESLQQVVGELNAALFSAIASNRTTKRPKDWDGKSIDAYGSAEAIFSQNINLPLGAPEITNFDVSLGRVKGATNTGIKSPEPKYLALLPKQYADQPYYLPYVDYPVDDEHFIFACVSVSPSLFSAADFLKPDSKQVSSIVKIQSSVNFQEPGPLASILSALGLSGASTITATACAKPGSPPDSVPSGVLTVQFANGQVGGLSHLRDIMTGSQLKSAQAETYTAQFGNYPDDGNSQLVRNLEDEKSGLYTANGAISTAFFDWLRSEHCRPNIMAINQVLDFNFPDQAQRLVSIFEFTTKGELAVHSSGISPFSPNTVAENQLLSQCSANMGFPCVMIIRNEAHHLGTINGGKEGGQPIVGDPINWCELSDFGESPEEALRVGRGSKALNLQVSGSPSARCRDANAISPLGAVYEDLKGRVLQVQPNPNYYSGGLAADILIGITNH